MYETLTRCLSGGPISTSRCVSRNGRRPEGVVFGSPVVATPGGKSLNQAIAAARLGGRSALVAKAGDDRWGRPLSEALHEAGVDGLHLLPGVTGTAIVELTPDGEGVLILSPAPAAELTAADVEQAFQRPAGVVVVQLDLDARALLPVGEQPAGRLIVGNLLPRGPICAEVWDRLDVFVGNRHEVAALTGAELSDPIEAARQVHRLGPTAVVVTLGPEGAAYWHSGGSGVVAAERVEVVDTTGAGDAFLGNLALSLARDEPLAEAVAAAVAVGTTAVTQEGSLLRR